MNDIFFTSDEHYSHDNICKYCNRPFPSAEEMDEALITNFNNKVPTKSLTFHLGDLGFFGRNKNIAKSATKRILSRLNGQHILFVGNHDPNFQMDYLPEDGRVISIFRENTIHELPAGIYGVPVVLCHYPLESWNRSFHGSFHLHGHTHGTIPFSSMKRRMDVGVDAHKYSPISWEEIKTELLAVPTPKELEGKVKKDWEDI
jgi:calcineurin-like phosphoesterase family protein